MMAIDDLNALFGDLNSQRRHVFTSDKGIAEFLDMSLVDITNVVISFDIQLINAQQVGFTGGDIGIAIFLVVVNAR